MQKTTTMLSLILLVGLLGCVRPLSALNRKGNSELAWAEVLILKHESGSLNLEEVTIVARSPIDETRLHQMAPLRGRPDKQHLLVVIRRNGAREEFRTTVWSDPVLGCFADATFSPTVWRSYIRYSGDIVGLRLKEFGTNNHEIPVRLWAMGSYTSNDFR